MLNIRLVFSVKLTAMSLAVVGRLDSVMQTLIFSINEPYIFRLSDLIAILRSSLDAFT